MPNSFAKITKQVPSNGLADVPGFSAAGVACDIRNDKKGRLDLSLIYSASPCNAAAVFTTNDVKAACVNYCQALLKNGVPFHGIITNSGNANACTGAQGDADTASMAPG